MAKSKLPLTRNELNEIMTENHNMKSLLKNVADAATKLQQENAELKKKVEEGCLERLVGNIIGKFHKGVYKLTIEREIWCEQIKENDRKEWCITLWFADWYKKGDAVAFTWDRTINNLIQRFRKKLEEMK